MGIWGVLNRKIGSRIRVPPIDFGGLDKNLLLIKNINQRGPPVHKQGSLGGSAPRANVDGCRVCTGIPASAAGSAGLGEE